MFQRRCPEYEHPSHPQSCGIVDVHITDWTWSWGQSIACRISYKVVVFSLQGERERGEGIIAFPTRLPTRMPPLCTGSIFQLSVIVKHSQLHWLNLTLPLWVTHFKFLQTAPHWHGYYQTSFFLFLALACDASSQSLLQWARVATSFCSRASHPVPQYLQWLIILKRQKCYNIHRQGFPLHMQHTIPQGGLLGRSFNWK